MHPIERLRYVARAEHVPARYLVQETAMALADFVGDDASLLIACRRILDRQPTSGPLVWLVAHALSAPNPGRALWNAAEAIEDDKAVAALAYALPDDAVVATIGAGEWLGDLSRLRGDVGLVVVDADGDADYSLERWVDEDQQVLIVDPSGAAQALGEATHVVLEVDAVGHDQAIVRQGGLSVAAVAACRELPVWALAATGTVLGPKMYGGLTRRWHERERAPLWERPVEEIETSLIASFGTHRGVVALADAVRQGGCPIVPELF